MSLRATEEVAYRFRSMLERGEWVVSVELDPPHGLSAERALEVAAELRAAGADCIDVGDSPMASVRMSAVAFAAAVQQRTGLEAIIHLGARDRNLLALQSDLMGAHMLGIRSVIALTGDPLSLGRYEGATAVWDVKAEGLIELIATINSGVDTAGNSLRSEGDFTIAAAANPNNPDLDAEMKRLAAKAEAGAQVFFTQPTFDAATVERFAERAAAIGKPVMLGVLLLSSARNASIMAGVPGIELPEGTVERMEAAGEDAAAVGLEMTQAFVERIRPLCAGIYVIAAQGRVRGVTELVRWISR